MAIHTFKTDVRKIKMLHILSNIPKGGTGLRVEDQNEHIIASGFISKEAANKWAEKFSFVNKLDVSIVFG